MIAKFLAVILMGYLLGSIPFGLIMGRLRARVDIRQYGSGRTGGTNVLRTMGRKAFVVVAALDIFKGFVAVVLAGVIVGGGYINIGTYDMGVAVAQPLAGLAAVMGHIWPLFARFKGGRGVGTYIGTLFAICPVAALFGGEIVIIGAGLSGFASLGSLAGVVGAYTLMIPLTLLAGFPIEYLYYSMAGTILIMVMHHDNIIRLFNGCERTISQKAELRGAQPAR